MPKIYTSYYGNRDLPKNAILIAVSAKVPDGFKVFEHAKSLAPTWDIYNEYKQRGDHNRYALRYKIEVLAKLDRARVYYRLNTIMRNNKKDVILLCYEKPNEFCHRHLIAEWLDMGIAEWEGGEK